MISNFLVAALAAGCLTLCFKLFVANKANVALQTEVEMLRLRLRKFRTQFGDI
jgi:hypothetical protein